MLRPVTRLVDDAPCLVSDYIDQSAWTWDMPKLKAYFTPMDVDVIQNIPKISCPQLQLNPKPVPLAQLRSFSRANGFRVYKRLAERPNESLLPLSGTQLIEKQSSLVRL